MTNGKIISLVDMNARTLREAFACSQEEREPFFLSRPLTVDFYHVRPSLLALFFLTLEKVGKENVHVTNRMSKCGLISGTVWMDVRTYFDTMNFYREKLGRDMESSRSFASVMPSFFFEEVARVFDEDGCYLFEREQDEEIILGNKIHIRNGCFEADFSGAAKGERYAVPSQQFNDWFREKSHPFLAP